MGRSNVLQAYSNYLICLHFIRINRVYASSKSFHLGGDVSLVIDCIAAVHILVYMYTAEVTQIVIKLHIYVTNHLKGATELREVKHTWNWR